MHLSLGTENQSPFTLQTCRSGETTCRAVMPGFLPRGLARFARSFTSVGAHSHLYICVFYPTHIPLFIPLTILIPEGSVRSMTRFRRHSSSEKLVSLMQRAKRYSSLSILQRFRGYAKTRVVAAARKEKTSQPQLFSTSPLTPLPPNTPRGGNGGLAAIAIKGRSIPHP